MKKIHFDLFGEDEVIYYNISKLSQLEELLGKPITEIVGNGTIGIGDIVKIFLIGVQGKRKTPQYYEEKIQQALDEGKSIEDFVSVAFQALIGSGILGKNAYYSMFPDEMTEEDKIEVEHEKN